MTYDQARSIIFQATSLADFYTGSMSLEVQLYTNGKRLSNGAMANTAVSDLTNYVNYMMSQMMTTEFSRDDLSLLTSGQIQDVTAIINDMNYELSLIHISEPTRP